MTDIPKLCDEIEALLKKVTPGPWRVIGYCNSLPFGNLYIIHEESGVSNCSIAHDNAELLSSLRNSAQPLIDAARESARLRERIKELELVRDCRRINGDKAVIISMETAKESLRLMLAEAQQTKYWNGLYADDRSFLLASLEELECATKELEQQVKES